MLRRRNNIVFPQFEMTTLQLLKESLKKKSKSCIKNCNDLLLILSLRSSLYDFLIFITSSSSFHGFIANQFNDLFPVGLVAHLERALHRYCRGQGFESRTSLNFFSGFLFATVKVASLTAMIYFYIIHPAVHVYDFHISIT